ncbi:PP2C family protein-serine/threonine phosphatase [Bacillus timonensis]|nr:PP2C family protein-serine/threonine phosphatase [Bacillus timonensis]
MSFETKIEEKYKDIVKRYLKNRDEQALYLGQKFSRNAIEQTIPPEEIIGLHKKTIHEIYPDISEEVLNSFDILLEVMMGYGLAYQEHQSLRSQQQELKSEIDIAANVQQTLLETDIPEVESLDIGAISVPAKQMSGDYYHFVLDDDNRVNIAIADVIGKGIPAALCMSMIKYAMDSLPESRNTPSFVLENLNRVVEQNVDINMFVTMLYGIYDTSTNVFSYGTAGHEPGFFYDAQTNQFQDIPGRGLVLGINRSTKYTSYSKELKPNDMIVLLSDGVTECRTDEGFIERKMLAGLIEKKLHLSSQQIVEEIYRELERLQDFQLRDDFTLIIIKRNV